MADLVPVSAGENVPLSEAEVTLFASLLRRLTWPIPSVIFHELVKKVITVPVELLVLNEKRHVLLVYRDDPEYPRCFHTPGTVVRDNENVWQALNRLIDNEVKSNLSAPSRLVWREVRRGSGEGENPTRHEISLPFICRTIGDFAGKGTFFHVDHLPPELLTHHRRMIGQFEKEIKEYPF